jgi:hypothetical protein
MIEKIKRIYKKSKKRIRGTDFSCSVERTEEFKEVFSIECNSIHEDVMLVDIYSDDFDWSFKISEGFFSREGKDGPFVSIEKFNNEKTRVEYAQIFFDGLPCDHKKERWWIHSKTKDERSLSICLHKVKFT